MGRLLTKDSVGYMITPEGRHYYYNIIAGEGGGRHHRQSWEPLHDSLGLPFAGFVLLNSNQSALVC